MDNLSILKIQKDFLKSKSIVIKSDDTSINIKEKYGNRFLDDISDSDVEDSMSYRNKNKNIINKLAEKTNTNIKNKTNNDSMSMSNFSINRKQIQTNQHENNKNNKNKEEDEEDEEEYEEEYEFIEDFENNVKTYVKTDDKIRELQKEIKELNQIKKNAEDAILKHLERLGETNINITGGKLIVNKYGSKASFKEDLVKEVMSEKIKDKKTVETIFEEIQKIRQENAKIQTGLKRTSIKKK
jgi:vacuolar-type H+-ATPase subunit I/STV1